ADRDRFQHVTPSPNAAIDVYLADISYGIDNVRKHFACGRRSIELAAAVIRYHDRLCAVFGRSTRVVTAAHTFDHHSQPARVTQPVEIVESKIFLEIGSDIRGKAPAFHFVKAPLPQQSNR